MWRIKTDTGDGPGAITRRGMEISILRIEVFNWDRIEKQHNRKRVDSCRVAVTHYQIFFFGAPFKTITNHKAWLSCLLKDKNTKTTQTRIVKWTDRLLQGKKMGLVDYLSGHLVGTTPKTSKLDNTFKIGQTNAVNRLIAPSASVNVDELKSQNEKITKKKTEREFVIEIKRTYTIGHFSKLSFDESQCCKSKLNG